MANLFAAAKKVETKTTTSAKEKERVLVAGIEADLIRYNAIKKEESNLKTEKEMLGGRLKEIAKAEYMKKYTLHKMRPESFNLCDGTGKVLVMVMDAYKKVEEAKEAALMAYPDLLDTKTSYTINPELLDKCGEAISEAINNSPDISAEDKANIILAIEIKSVKKGTIDRLMQYSNPEELFGLIEPTVAFK